MGRIWDGVFIMGRVCRCGVESLEAYRTYYGWTRVVRWLCKFTIS